MFIQNAFATVSKTNSSSVLVNLVPLLIFITIFYLFLIRPQQKQMKKHKKMLKELKSGDKVVTGGGIIGIVKKNEGEKIVVEIEKGVKIKVLSETVKSLIK